MKGQLVVLVCGLALLIAGVLVAVTSSSSSSYEASSPTILGGNPIFEDPEEVAKANPFLASDATIRAMDTTIDDTRDLFEQLQGGLDARSKDEDCDGIHDLAKKIKEAHGKYELLEIEYPKLSKDNRQSVSVYLQERLTGLVRTVTTNLVKELLKCEQSQHLYAEAVAGIRIVSAKLDAITKRMEKNEEDCVAIQKHFHDGVQEIEDFHEDSDKKIRTMKEMNMIVAADQALLETSARVHPAEHEFYLTYDRLWEENCKEKADKALGLGKDGGKDGGKAAASGSGSASS